MNAGTGAQPCYILHQRPYRETSLILEVFSREHGRLGLVARGARRAGNRQRPLCQPLRRVEATWFMRAELGTLTQIEAAGVSIPLTGESVIAAFYLNELLMRLLHRHEPHPRLFDAYEQALDGLHRKGTREAVLRVFEKRLLQALGYGLILDHEILNGEPLDEGREYFYLAEQGPSSEPAPGGRSVRVSGATLNALQREDLADAAQLVEAKRLLRMILAGHLGQKPLASRDLYRKYLVLSD